MVLSVKICSGKTAFEITSNIRIDLTKASQIFNTKVATKQIILLTYNGVNVSMYPSGRMLIKARDKEESLVIARYILAELGLKES